jgi:hypothetical protein
VTIVGTKSAGRLTVGIVFAKTEESVILHGDAVSAPKVKVQSGKAGLNEPNSPRRQARSTYDLERREMHA